MLVDSYRVTINTRIRMSTNAPGAGTHMPTPLCLGALLVLQLQLIGLEMSCDLCTVQ